jgi:hypothetical protein
VRTVTDRSPLPAPLLVGSLLLAFACSPPGEGVIALEGATLIDGSGGAPVRDALVLIRNGKIEAVARVNEIPVPRGAEVIPAVGKTIIPGLIDAHAHVERWAAPRYLAWGVTTVRDMGLAHPDTAIAVKNDLNLGVIIGPRVYSSGGMVDGAPPTIPTATAVRTRDEARRAVDQRALSNADFVKVYTKITPELLGPLIDEAKSLRMRVAGHLGKTDALTAARAGVVSLEHASGVVAAAVPNPEPYLRAQDQFFAGWAAEVDGWSTLDSAAVARVARALAPTRVSVVPTLVLYETLSGLGDRARRAPVGLDDVPADYARVRDVAAVVRRAGLGAPQLAALRRARVRLDQFVREYRRAGGAVVAGSDAPGPLLVPGASLHDEMALLVRAGFTPLEAITAATRRGAQLLGADSLGMVAPRKVADLVVLHSNPTRNIAATRNVAWVMLRGRILRPDSVRKAWAR